MLISLGENKDLASNSLLLAMIRTNKKLADEKKS
jgi:hypothetical protein